MRPRRALLERCLRALGREAPPRGAEALVVVDDHTAADGLVSLSNDLLVVRPLVQAGGAARRRNAAFAVLEGDVVALLDDDAEPLEGWGAALAARFAGPEAAVVQGAIWPDWEVEPGPEVAGVIFSIGGFNRFADRTRADVFISANCAFPRKVLERVGPMREDLGPGSGGVPWGDDTQWHGRARALDIPTVFDEAMAARHRVQADRVSPQAVLDRAERVGRTLARLEWDGRKPRTWVTLRQNLLARWGAFKAGRDLESRCLARRLSGYADEIAIMRNA